MIVFVKFPSLPVPIFFLSTLIIGVISAAVPERKTSLADFNSSFVIFFIFVFNPKSLLNVKIHFLVIPSNADELNGGVNNVLFLIMNIFSPGASLTYPFLSKSIASSKPLFFASCVAKIEFR